VCVWVCVYERERERGNALTPRSGLREVFVCVGKCVLVCVFECVCVCVCVTERGGNVLTPRSGLPEVCVCVSK